MKNILRLLWVSLALAIAAVALAQAPQKIDQLQVTTSYTLESGANMDLVSGSTFTFGIAGTTNSLLYLTNSGGNVGALGLGAGLSVSGGNLVAASSTSHNPTATIGLSAVNGTAGTFMTSDSAPALGVNIAPTWTNNHTFQITNSLTSGQGYGLQLEPILNQRNAANFSAFQINEWITQAGTGPQYLIQGQTSNGSGGSTVDVFDVNAVGDVTTGIWEGTAVGSIYGGTGLSSFAEGTTLTASGSNTWTALAPGALNYIYTSGGAGAVTSWQSLSTMLSTLGTAAQGDIIYNNGSAWVYLVPGTSGYYLETLGASANPQWAAVSPGPVITTTHDVASYSNTTGSFEDTTLANLSSNRLNVVGTENDLYGTVYSLNNSNGGTVVVFDGLAPFTNTGSDHEVKVLFGVAQSSKNLAYIGMNYAGSSNANNYIAFGTYGTDDLVTIGTTGVLTTIGGLVVTPTARTSVWGPYVSITAAADTGMTASTAFPGVKLATASRQWAAGTVPTQGEVEWDAPTYTGAGATAIFTQAATEYIKGPPIAGSNAAITTPYDLLLGGSGGLGIGAAPAANLGAGMVQHFYNGFATAGQTPSATTRTLVTGSHLHFPAGQIQVGTVLHWQMDITKTAAGTAAATFDIAFGTNGTTADTAQVSFTKPAGAAQVDHCLVIIEAIVETNSSSGVVLGNFTMSVDQTSGTLGGFLAAAKYISSLTTTSSTFNTTTPTDCEVCVTTGASDAWTINQCSAYALNL